MENGKTLTYGQLIEKLKSYGYTAYNVTIGEKKGISLENNAVPGSRILLPDRRDSDPVEPFYMNHVLMILRGCGILKESNPLLS
jgi:hypothetical protein